jgi:hypothetical protein
LIFGFALLTPKQIPFRERYEGLRADGRHGSW